MNNYSVWYDRQEQWDPDDIDEPDFQCEAKSSDEAAERLADDCDRDYGEFIVRNNNDGTYRRVELVRSWRAKLNLPTSLAELCSP